MRSGGRKKEEIVIQDNLLQMQTSQRGREKKEQTEQIQKGRVGTEPRQGRPAREI